MLSVLLALGLDYALFMLTRFEENRSLTEVEAVEQKF